jgi:hypothetical protein
LFDHPMIIHHATDKYIDPPECLVEMLTCAKTLGQAYGTYVRADFYVSKTGCVFGEFQSTPILNYTFHRFTKFADEYFGALWQQTFPDSI